MNSRPTNDPLPREYLEFPSFEDVVHDLKKIRIGSGLSAQKLKNLPRLVKALRARSTDEAAQRLHEMTLALGEDQNARALRSAYGIGMNDPGILKDRRAQFSLAVKKYDIGTLIGYEDAAIARLATKITTINTPVGDADGLQVNAVVSHKKILHFELIAFNLEDAKRGQGHEMRTTMWTNPSGAGIGPDEVSIPCVIWQTPPEWNPAMLALAVRFAAGPKPRRCWATQANSVMYLLFSAEKMPLEIEHDSIVHVQFDHEDKSALYAIWWEY